ncbi:hypothetical protein IWZ01DRAFT_281515 [Phyllosticta capitalensis]
MWSFLLHSAARSERGALRSERICTKELGNSVDVRASIPAVERGWSKRRGKLVPMIRVHSRRLRERDSVCGNVEARNGGCTSRKRGLEEGDTAGEQVGPFEQFWPQEESVVPLFVAVLSFLPFMVSRLLLGLSSSLALMPLAHLSCFEAPPVLSRSLGAIPRSLHYTSLLLPFPDPTHPAHLSNSQSLVVVVVVVVVVLRAHQHTVSCRCHPSRSPSRRTYPPLDPPSSSLSTFMNFEQAYHYPGSASHRIDAHSHTPPFSLTRHASLPTAFAHGT